MRFKFYRFVLAVQGVVKSRSFQKQFKLQRFLKIRDSLKNRTFRMFCDIYPAEQTVITHYISLSGCGSVNVEQDSSDSSRSCFRYAMMLNLNVEDNSDLDSKMPLQSDISYKLYIRKNSETSRYSYYMPCLENNPKLKALSYYSRLFLLEFDGCTPFTEDRHALVRVGNQIFLISDSGEFCSAFEKEEYMKKHPEISIMIN